ncbi:MAG: isochorismatase family protein [Kiloniellaceae bacterium]
MDAPARAFKGDLLLIVDVQERLAPAIPAAPLVAQRIAALIEKARETGLPILASEQYSRGLGGTVPALRHLLADGEMVEKIHFAAPREAAFVAALEARGARRCFVAGMEAHVCVLQSALALLDRGLAVTMIADAVASRADLDRRLALARLARAGATLADSAGVIAAWTAGAEALSPPLD